MTGFFYMGLLVFSLLSSKVTSVGVPRINGIFSKMYGAEYWSYEKIDEWPETCRNRTEQSPINIEKDSTTRTTFSKLVFYNYYKTGMVLQNTGHSVEYRIYKDRKSHLSPYLGGGPLGSDYYVLQNFHFHWNSEHTIDSSSYPLEGHFLHFKSKLGNFTNAMNYIYGFTVVAVMYTVEDPCDNNVFDDILAEIHHVSKNVGASIKLSNNINIFHLFPTDTSKYFVYNGSFTTPDCNEGVLWTVLEEPSCISKSQVINNCKIGATFFTLKNSSYHNH